MPDIEDLHNLADEYDDGDGGVLVAALRWAADEIENLKRNNAALRSEVKGMADFGADKIARLEREVYTLEKRAQADGREIAHLEQACTEWSDASLATYQRAKKAEAEVQRLEALRDKDAVTVIALHEAAGGDKGLSSADLLEYTRLAMKQVREKVRREALEEAAGVVERSQGEFNALDMADNIRAQRA